MKKAYGSGYFGEWITDYRGCPAFDYTCNQTKDPKALSPTNPLWRAENDQTFQIGNDRITGIVSNFGYVQARQDEGGPKLLSDFDPSADCYGGGLGYLADSGEIIGTWYDGQPHFRRIYGIDYVEKECKSSRLQIRQRIQVPFGDDPVMVSDVLITNLSDTPLAPTWYEYWGARHYPLSFRPVVLGVVAGISGLNQQALQKVPETRRKLAKAFSTSFTRFGENRGLAEQKTFQGLPEDLEVWNRVRDFMRANAERNHSNYAHEFDEIEDLRPPETFLYALDHTPDGFYTCGRAFFAGNPVFPEITAQCGVQIPALIAYKQVRVEPGRSVRLSYLYGYLPKGFQRDALIRKYERMTDTLPDQNAKNWKNHVATLSVKGKPWVERETVWHNAYLRGGMSYDSYFGEHILSQGHVYQYLMGFQGAARDQLQHALPFVYSDPDIARQVIRYTLGEVLPDGEIPYGIVGHGCLMPSPYISSDFELWLFWLVSEYVLATKDREFLYETIIPYPYKGIKRPAATLLGIMRLCYEHFMTLTSSGSHGLSKLLHGDWNDNIVVGGTPEDAKDTIWEEGESVLVGAFASYALNRYAGLLDFLGEPGADEARNRANRQREAVKAQWNGSWYRRAYLSHDLGWVGNDILWLEPQPWALLGGAAEEHKTQLVQSIDKMVRQPSPIGAMLISQSVPQFPSAAGNLTNAGVWPSINGTLIKALVEVDPEMAWEEWLKNTLAVHAEAYPEKWVGTWSAADCYNSELADDPGGTEYIPEPQKRAVSMNWMDFPVLNLHPHAWPLYNAADFIVKCFTSDGIVLQPRLPEPAYKFSSALLSFERNEKGYSGRYCPLKDSHMVITLLLSEKERKGALIMDGKEAAFDLLPDGVRFETDGAALWEWVLSNSSVK